MKEETKFKLKVAADLKTLTNIWFVKTNEVSVRGIPDYIICLNGLFVAIELKRAVKSRPDSLQTYNLQKIETKAQGIGLVAYPENWGYILDMLKKLDQN